MKRFRVQKIVSDQRASALKADYGYVDTDHKYLVVNVDEPYAEKVFEMIKAAEKEKGTWDGSDKFEDFVQNI